ncbi:aldo/keto reductase [Phytomonospora endophytica]|uniref:NDP-hexose 2,3-enoyl reductase n=1 Tax=Phytomonospora endophytica TaxID=714109 RepID=A0A841FF59_9ACTN|nr:aldo/keto reductase [Phytomonospora endophytica]MBB6034906.1 NDP-hexose 2,3-enoyl reductase [Phytomonospora endophytica]GIG70610.1 oxidoreductase [Phytomonospora endophytica]
MEYTPLGRCGLVVSRLCLGTMNFGPHTSEADAHTILDRALDVGVNYVDTANSYGGRRGEGVTEQIIGAWFDRRDLARDKVVLATKVYTPMSTWPNDGRLSARHIIASCEASLRRLRTDRIDVLQMHHVDRNVTWDEIWQAMDTLVAQGKIRYAGSSNFAGWHLAAAQESAVRRHSLGLVSEQCRYNLITRHAELEVLPAARHYGIAVVPWSPLESGLLGGVLAKQAKGTSVRGDNDRGELMREHHDAIEAYEKLCADIGTEPAVLALAWLLSRPGVTAPIVGPRTVGQLDGALAALDLTVDAAITERLDALFPPIGAGGPAPEAWAW